MENISKRHILSLLIAAGGCIAGAYSAFAAFSNGETLAGGTAGVMFGLAFAAVVVISWIMLPWADKHAGEGSYREAWLWRLSWLLALGFVLANSIAFCSHYRTEMTEAKGLLIDAYDRAQRAEAEASAELKGLQLNFRWEATSGCSNVTAPKSKRYCERLGEAQSRIEAARATLAQGKPGAKDAGAETLAWVFGVYEANIRRGLPIFWAVILELVASLCMREAFATLRPNAAAKTLRAGTAPRPGLPASVPASGYASAGAQAPTFPSEAQLGHPNIIAWPYHATNDNVPLTAYAS